jgi:Family of unknown function (DUF6314)
MPREMSAGESVSLSGQCVPQRMSHAVDWNSPDKACGRLLGRWALDRSFDTGARMTGMATFVAGADDDLAYHEQGALLLPDGQAFEAKRRYLFRPRCGGFDVMFAETPARLFHNVLLRLQDGALIGDASHQCGQDHYRSRYEFRPSGTLLVRHDVRGPRKRYRSHTTYIYQGL